MKAILAAAGVGSRISKHFSGPKCTMEIEGKPLIRRTVEMLNDNNLEVAVIVGYESDKVVEALSGLKVEYYNNPFFNMTNSIGSLWFARDFIDGDTIIANADVFWDSDILGVLLDSKEKITMLVDRSCAKQGDYCFKLDGDLVSKYGKGLSEFEKDAEYVGIALINSSAISDFKRNLNSMIDRGDYNLWWENVLYEHSENNPIYTIDISDKFWAEIDYVEDYNRIIKYVKTNDLSSKYYFNQ